jgi:hypothetical protein
MLRYYNSKYMLFWRARNILTGDASIQIGDIVGIHNCPLNKHLHNMGLIDELICIACGMKDETAFHLLCDCPSLISLRMRTFSKPILSVEEYEGGCLHLHCCDSRLQMADLL